MGRTPAMMGAPQVPPSMVGTMPVMPQTAPSAPLGQMPQLSAPPVDPMMDRVMPAATPRDIFQSVDPSQFLMTPQQESDRQSKQQQVMIAQILSNQAGNAANFFKPGAYDMGAQAKVFDGLNRMTDEPIAALGRKQNATQQAEVIEQRRLANDSVRAKMDPNSDISKGLRSRVIEEARARAKMVPSMAEVLEAKAASYERGQQTGVDAEAELKSLKSLFGDAMKNDYNQAVAGNQAASIEQRREESLASNSERAADRDLRKEQHYNQMALKKAELEIERIKAAGAGDKLHAMINKPQEKLNEEIENLEYAVSAMGDLASLKKQVNTGFAMDKVSKLGAAFDLTSDERNRLNALVAKIFNTTVKQLAGAAVSDAEWTRISPQIPQTNDDDNVFLAKLANATTETRRMLAHRKDQYQRIAGGGTIDQSNTAKRSTGQRQVTAPTATADAAKAERARQVLANPNATPAARAGAQKYLDDHGAK